VVKLVEIPKRVLLLHMLAEIKRYCLILFLTLDINATHFNGLAPFSIFPYPLPRCYKTDFR
jgi:hypothetical protein